LELKVARPDYYAILGILPSAEDVVIKAAYRALAQRYHPDKFKGSPSLATAKMAELNEAYGVLSDAAKRKAYDTERGLGATESEEAFRSGGDDVPPYDPLENDWAIAVEHFPDLDRLEGRLRVMNWRLSYSYRILLLSDKSFDERYEIAEKMESEFLRCYFGSNPDVLGFARDLIFDGQKVAARELNRAISVLGSTVNSDAIISRIRQKFLPDGYKTESDRLRALQAAEQSATGDFLFWTGLGAIGLFILILISVA